MSRSRKRLIISSMSIFLLSIGMASILVVSGFNGTYKAESELIKAIVIFNEDTYGTQNESYILEKFEIIVDQIVSAFDGPSQASSQVTPTGISRINANEGVSSAGANVQCKSCRY